MLQIVPVTLKAANAFVTALHRHHRPTAGHKFSIAVADTDHGQCVGVAIIGRPVARMLDNGWTLEVNRVCTDGTANACSKLYGAASRVVKELGYQRLITYTLPEEGGVSLKAAGWKFLGERGGGEWGRPSRQRLVVAPISVKWLWEKLFPVTVPLSDTQSVAA